MTNFEKVSGVMSEVRFVNHEVFAKEKGNAEVTASIIALVKAHSDAAHHLREFQAIVGKMPSLMIRISKEAGETGSDGKHIGGPKAVSTADYMASNTDVMAAIGAAWEPLTVSELEAMNYTQRHGMALGCCNDK